MFTPLEQRRAERDSHADASLRGGRLWVSRLHHDERGTISIVAVFTFMMFAMLLGMVMNVGYQVDGKVKMQNAADAATYSGGIVLARAMNTLAFTNHLLCDAFATTALLREGGQRNAQSLTPPILAAWQKIAPELSASPFPKFAALGPAVAMNVPMEQQMINTYSDWMAATSALILPTWELILSQELIPQFQRALTAATPQMAQQAANEIARRHGLTQPQGNVSARGTLEAVMWRTSGQAIGGDGELARRTLPVVDPELDMLPDQLLYAQAAQSQRNGVAHTYLRQWNDVMMSAFDTLGKMSQFGRLWRGFTCGQLNKLLNQDYPNNNLPFQLRSNNGVFDNAYLEQDYHFVGVAYWPQVPEILPGLFSNSSNADAQTFAEITMFIPRNRLVYEYPSNATGSTGLSIGGVPGGVQTLPGTGSAAGANTGGNNNTPIGVGRQAKDVDWSLLNQSWNVKLAPAVSATIPQILSTPPPASAQLSRQPRVPSLGQPTGTSWNLLYTH